METPADLEDLIDRPASHLGVDDPSVRRLAVSCCVELVGADDAVFAGIATMAIEDADDEVRAEAVEVLATCGPRALPTVRAAGADSSDRVVEAAATALGEIPDAGSVEWLIEVATSDRDKLVREAAVAALGAVGDDRAVPVLVELAGSAAPQVRRRAVVALSVFDGPGPEAAIRAALDDRNPMVREAAEMVSGLSR